MHGGIRACVCMKSRFHASVHLHADPWVRMGSDSVYNYNSVRKGVSVLLTGLESARSVEVMLVGYLFDI